MLREKRVSLTNVAYEEIRNSILLGKLTPGQKIVVNDLVAEWNISNTPIKEALNRLVAEGLVDFEPRRGMRVRRQLTIRELQQTMELREVLETHCCRVAATKIAAHAGVIAEMELCLENIRRLMESAHFTELYHWDSRFHRQIALLSENDLLIEHLDALTYSMTSFGVLPIKYSLAERMDDNFAEHKAVLDALRRGDGDGMAVAMSRHLRNSGKSIIDFYRLTEK